MGPFKQEVQERKLFNVLPGGCILRVRTGDTKCVEGVTT
jgi:hypothetical protein